MTHPYRNNPSSELCAVCREAATARCAGCGEWQCEVHAAACAECATRALARQRRVTNRLGIGAAVFLVPALIAGIFASVAGWTAVFLPPILVMVLVSLFAIPAATRRMFPPPKVPALLRKRALKLLPPAPTAPVCERCAASTERCTRCGAARCDEHAIVSGPTRECRDASACWQPRRRPPQTQRRQNAKTLYSTVDS